MYRRCCIIQVRDPLNVPRTMECACETVNFISQTSCPCPRLPSPLNQIFLNGELDGINLALELFRLAGGDTSGDHRPRDVASTSKGSLGGDENVWDVLLFT